MTEKWAWNCDKCRKQGTTEVREDAKIVEIAYALKESHSLESPDCLWSAGRVAVKKV